MTKASFADVVAGSSPDAQAAERAGELQALAAQGLVSNAVSPDSVGAGEAQEFSDQLSDNDLDTIGQAWQEFQQSTGLVNAGLEVSDVASESSEYAQVPSSDDMDIDTELMEEWREQGWQSPQDLADNPRTADEQQQNAAGQEHGDEQQQRQGDQSQEPGSQGQGEQSQAAGSPAMYTESESSKGLSGAKAAVGTGVMGASVALAVATGPAALIIALMAAAYMAAEATREKETSHTVSEAVQFHNSDAQEQRAADGQAPGRDSDQQQPDEVGARNVGDLEQETRDNERAAELTAEHEAELAARQQQQGGAGIDAGGVGLNLAAGGVGVAAGASFAAGAAEQSPANANQQRAGGKENMLDKVGAAHVEASMIATEVKVAGGFAAMAASQVPGATAGIQQALSGANMEAATDVVKGAAGLAAGFGAAVGSALGG